MNIKISDEDAVKCLIRTIDRLSEENADLRSEVKLLQEINSALHTELALNRRKNCPECIKED